ncbi:hypothetical protein V5O48_018916 [Marasmius crinis-equi]|uniref:Uncharacterized protein n=1 Tax=Marasmius crinis-equi TaxID=585013 RepID=A0ABR3EJU7_9AGAR
MSRFELWSYGDGQVEKEKTLQQWRQECVGMLGKTKVKNSKQQMAYSDNYFHTIIIGLGVRLVGYPFHEDPESEAEGVPVPPSLLPVLKLTSPYSITKMEDIKLLH